MKNSIVHNCPNLDEIKDFLGADKLLFVKFADESGNVEFTVLSIAVGGKHVGIYIKNGSIDRVVERPDEPIPPPQ